jgi:NAD(P)-dependent dehydrogenase (short-subunit alcohol dehydrogenase family)
MRIFCTGVTGYIGGSIAAAMTSAGHEVSGLVRSERSAEEVRALGITAVHGALDDVDVLRAAALRADLVLNAANSDHEPSAQAILETLEGTGKAYIHTSGSSIVGTQSAGERVDAIFNEETPIIPSIGRAARVALNKCILLQGERRSLGHHLSKSHLRYWPRASQAQHPSSMAYRAGEERWRRQTLWYR